MGQQDNKARERAALFKAMGVVTVCGLDIAVLILIGILVGAFGDGRLHSSPWGVLVGLFAGLASGIYSAYLIIAPVIRSL